MTPTVSTSSDSNALSTSRGWLIFGGILSILVGFSAISSPMLYSLILARFLGIFALVSGVISLLLAIVGKHKGHRLMEAFRVLSGLRRVSSCSIAWPPAWH